MITVHHLENSRSLRVIWLLEELGLEYELKVHKRNPETNLAPDSYRQLHKLGKAPVVQVGDEMLAETAAIVEYFMDHYPQAGLRPNEGAPNRQSYHYWMHASEGSLMPLLIMALFFGRMETVPPFFIRPFIKLVTSKIRQMYLSPSTENMISFIEAELGKSDYFIGNDLSAADIMMSFPLEAASARVAELEKRPNIKAWLNRIHERPAYKRAVEKGGVQEILGS